MKYMVRAIKYFACLAVMLFIFIFLLSVFGLVGTNPDEIFRDGTASIWKIALILLVFALIYPRLGYGKRDVFVPGAYPEIREGVVDVMHARGYVLEGEDGENLRFRLRSPVIRVFRMFEDRISFERYVTGFLIEGGVALPGGSEDNQRR